MERPGSGPYTARKTILNGPQCNTILIFYIFINAYINKLKIGEKNCQAFVFWEKTEVSESTSGSVNTACDVCVIALDWSDWHTTSDASVETVATVKKRKVDAECCVFQEKWTNDFVEVKGKPVCLVCGEARWWNLSPLDFYKLYVCAEDFRILRRHALEFASLFGTTYRCEQFFSKLTLAKTRLRSRLTDSNLENQLRVASSSLPADIRRLAKEKQFQPSH